MRTLHCIRCGGEVGRERGEIGYKYCLMCGDDVAKEERASWCVAPMHKSNYMLFTRVEDLAGINNKGGIVK